jgi:outer membrane immunogenic protein
MRIPTSRLRDAVIGAVSGLILASAAVAADLPAAPMVTKAPVAVIAQTWQGVYVGANAGGAWSRSCWLFDPNGTPVTEGCSHPSGAVAGGQIGVNWQSGNLVAGLEAAGDWANLKGSHVSEGFPNFTNDTKTDAIGMFTGRLGWASNAWLLYVKGGAAVVRNRYDTFITATPAAAGFSSDTRWGWVAGAGVEYMFLPNWSLAVEYDYIDAGSKVVTFSDPTGLVCTGGPCDERIKQQIHMVTARLNYRFWSWR